MLLSYVILFHTDRYPPILVPANTLAVSGQDMPDVARQLPHPLGHGDVKLPNVCGAHVLRRLDSVIGFAERGFEHVLVEDPIAGVWRRYRAVPLGRRGSVLHTLASAWSPYDRLSVDPSLDLRTLGQRTLLKTYELDEVLGTLARRGMVFETPERHGIRRWAYVPEAPAKCTPWIESTLRPYAEDPELDDRMRRALRGALTAYCGVMGKSYDPHRTVSGMRIEQIAVQIYAKMTDPSAFPVVVGAALATLKRHLAGDLPEAVNIAPAGEVT